MIFSPLSPFFSEVVDLFSKLKLKGSILNKKNFVLFSLNSFFHLKLIGIWNISPFPDNLFIFFSFSKNKSELGIKRIDIVSSVLSLKKKITIFNF